jgi:hypothetical protein
LTGDAVNELNKLKNFMPNNSENDRPLTRRTEPEQQSFLSLITGSFSMPAAENPTVAMVEAAYEHHHINAPLPQL